MSDVRYQIARAPANADRVGGGCEKARATRRSGVVLRAGLA
jgi:hypothetical protein